MHSARIATDYPVPAEGNVDVNGVCINERDGAAISGIDALSVTALSDCEVVVVDVE